MLRTIVDATRRGGLARYVMPAYTLTIMSSYYDHFSGTANGFCARPFTRMLAYCRFANHSCDPNLQVAMVRGGTGASVGIDGWCECVVCCVDERC